MSNYCFLTPILPGGEELMREWIRDESINNVNHDRVFQIAGITREQIWIQRTSMGDFAVASFEVEDPEMVPRMLSRVKVFLFAESLGGVESLITYPAVQTHADIDEEVRVQLGINDRLVRLSVGVEHVDDLIDDLAFAMGG